MNLVGEAQLESFKLTKLSRFLGNLFSRIGKDVWAAKLWRKYASLNWNTGFIKNGTPNVAFAVVAARFIGTASAAAGYIAVGTDTTAFAASQTVLGAEITDSGLARAAATTSLITTTQTNDTAQLLKAFTATGSKTIQEIGIFNDPTVGTMLGRTITGARAVVSGDGYIATYKVKFSS